MIKLVILNSSYKLYQTVVVVLYLTCTPSINLSSFFFFQIKLSKIPLFGIDLKQDSITWRTFHGN